MRAQDRKHGTIILKSKTVWAWSLSRLNKWLVLTLLASLVLHRMSPFILLVLKAHFSNVTTRLESLRFFALVASGPSVSLYKLKCLSARLFLHLIEAIVVHH